MITVTHKIKSNGKVFTAAIEGDDVTFHTVDYKVDNSENEPKLAKNNEIAIHMTKNDCKELVCSLTRTLFASGF